MRMKQVSMIPWGERRESDATTSCRRLPRSIPSTMPQSRAHWGLIRRYYLSHQTSVDWLFAMLVCAQYGGKTTHRRSAKTSPAWYESLPSSSCLHPRQTSTRSSTRVSRRAPIRAGRRVIPNARYLVLLREQLDTAGSASLVSRSRVSEW